jgi:hypothetical protein
MGSILVDWLSGSIRVSEPPRSVDESTVPLPYVQSTAPSTGGQAPSEVGAEYKPSYSPTYENPSFSEEESSTVREARPSDQQLPTPIANSSDIRPPAPAPTAPPEGQGSPDRDQITTSPKSSNAALREALKSKGR